MEPQSQPQPQQQQQQKPEPEIQAKHEQVLFYELGRLAAPLPLPDPIRRRRPARNSALRVSRELA
ncbi:hypothetical protein GBA52_017428 [Prunus armeniaca]|nr:hypothetical protein GBA52_017428 [Prunus armeniaca]